MTRRALIEKKTGIRYLITYDEYGVLDTVQRESDGAMLSSKNALVKKFIRNTDLILRGFAPKGFV